jgi:integrase
MPAISRKPEPILSPPHLFKRGGRFHYRRRVPLWLQPLVGTATWWENLGSDPDHARREAVALSRRYDRLCTPNIERLVKREGGASRVLEHLTDLALEPLAGPPAEILDGLSTASPEVMRSALMFHAAITDMAKADQDSAEQRDRLTARLAPIVAALEPDTTSGGMTVSEAAAKWLEDTKPASARRYGMVLRRFKELIGDLPLTAVDTQTIWRFRDLVTQMPSPTGLPASIRASSSQVQLDWRREKNAKLKTDEQPHPSILPGAMENHVAVLRSLFAWCLRRKFVSANPVVDIDVPDDPRGKDAHHHPALSYDELPAFMVILDSVKRPAATALKFTILTCARTEEVLRAAWEEFDLEKRIWTVPAGRMKGRKEHLVPLSQSVVDLLACVPRDHDLVFRRMAHDTMRDFLHRHMQRQDITVHGFRSTFRDWVAEETSHPSDAAELALAHSVKNKVEAAYRRGSMFAKRRTLMEDWAKFALSGVSLNDQNVSQNDT